MPIPLPVVPDFPPIRFCGNPAWTTPIATFITMKTTGLKANAVASITAAVAGWKRVILLSDTSLAITGVATANAIPLEIVVAVVQTRRELESTPIVERR